MSKRIISKLHNGLGNQMFIYASSYGLSKKYKRKLFLDNESNFFKFKYIKKSFINNKYSLDCFNLSCDFANKKDKFLGIFNYFKLKILKFLDSFREDNYRLFINEYKDLNKISHYQENILSNLKQKKIFLNGHFETEKYFFNFRNDIKKEFSFKKENLFKRNKLYLKIKKSNSLAICIRQHRYSEKLSKVTYLDKSESQKFTFEQINYINKALKMLRKKVKNYKIFVWSNDYRDINKLIKFKNINLIKTNNVVLDLFLMSNCKYFIVIPSTFNWWGAWLSARNNKIVYRPHESNFSKYKTNNVNFWPNKWISVK